MQSNLHGKKCIHIRTGKIRIIFEPEKDTDTPSGNCLKQGYSSQSHLLIDTYITNKQFWKLIN